MQLLYDLLPIIVFFVIYKIHGIYWATGAAIIVSLVQVIFYRIKHKKYEKMQVITLILIAVLGGATLILHKPIYIKWKPTAINWLFAIVFLGSHVIGKKPLIRYIMEKKVELPSIVWSRLNLSWVAFFFLTGLANIYVVYHYSTDTWVNFKLFGMLGLTFIFVIIQAFYLAKHIKVVENQDG